MTLLNSFSHIQPLDFLKTNLYLDVAWFGHIYDWHNQGVFIEVVIEEYLYLEKSYFPNIL